MLFQLTTLLLLTNNLKPEGYGVLNYCYSIATLFIFLNSFGMESNVVNYLIKFKKNYFKVVYSAIYIRICGALISMLIINIIGGIVIEDKYLKILFIISMIHIFLPATTFDWYFQALGKGYVAAIANIFSQISGFIFRIYVIYFENSNINILVYSYVIEIFFLAFIYLVYYYKKNKKVNKKNNVKCSSLKFKFIILLFRRSMPLMFSAALILGYTRLDQIMIGKLLGVEYVGIYAAGMRLCEAILILFSVAISIYYPKMLHEKKEKGEKYYSEKIINFGRILFWVSVITAIIISFLSENIVNTLYSSDYKESHHILSIGVWIVPFSLMGLLSTRYMVSKGLQNLVVRRALASFLLNFFLNILMIPLIGIYGAVISTCVSQLVSGFLFNAIGGSKEFFNIQLKIIFGVKYDSWK